MVQQTLLALQDLLVREGLDVVDCRVASDSCLDLKELILLRGLALLSLELFQSRLSLFSPGLAEILSRLYARLGCNPRW